MKNSQAIVQSTTRIDAHRNSPRAIAALLTCALAAALLPQTSRGVSVTADFFQGVGLDAAANYKPSSQPTNQTDVLLDSAQTVPLTFNTATNLSMESLNMTSLSKKSSYTIGATAASAGTGASNLTLTLGNSAGFNDLYNPSVANDVIYLTSSSTLTIAGANTGTGTGTFSLSLAGASRFDVTSGSTLNINAPIASTGAYAVIKGSAGVLNLGAANSFTGTFTVANGTTNLNAVSALGGVTDITVGSSSAGAGILATNHLGLTGTIGTTGATPNVPTLTITVFGANTGLADLSGSMETVSSLSGPGNLLIGDYTNPTTMAVTTGTFTVTSAADSTFSGAISGTSAGTILTKRGSGNVLTLSGANTFVGGVNLLGGTLQVSSAENAGTSGPLGKSGTISFGGGILQFSSSNAYDYSPRFSQAAGQKYFIGTNNQTVTLASPLTSVGGTLTKTNGLGTLILTGNNTYDGGTTINGGGLQISNASGTSATGSGPVMINTLTTVPGILQGTGYINAGANVITINTGTLSPGAGVGSVGTINLASTAPLTATTGALTLAATSTLAFDITDTTTKDLVALGGSTLALNGGKLALNLPNTTASGIDYTSTTNYALFTGVSGLTGSGFATVTGYDSTDYVPQFALNGTEYDLYFVPVPEPSTWCGGLLLVGALAWHQRRRRWPAAA